MVRSRVQRFIGLAIAVLCMGALPSAASAAGEEPPSLVGTNLESALPFSDPPEEFTVRCERTSTSTISYTVAGLSIGTYPGTFTESGTITLGTLEGPADVGTTAPVTAFSARFEIISPTGTVRGTKTLQTDPIVAVNTGFCGATPPSPAGEFTSFLATGTFSYRAVIETIDGTFTDSGSGLFTASGSDQTDTLGQFPSPDQISERFTSSTGVQPLTCKKTGSMDVDLFKNQGDCVSFLSTDGKNEPGQNLPGLP
jgi:hypothetical protein